MEDSPPRMVISNENSQPISIHSLNDTVIDDYFWCLDLNKRDFVLRELKVFEQMVTPTFSLLVNNYYVEAPTNWHVLVYSEETSQLDLVEISELSRGSFNLLLYDHNKHAIRPGLVQVKHYSPATKLVSPQLNKGNMLCHHVGTKYWMCMCASDNFNKYLKNSVIGDLLEIF